MLTGFALISIVQQQRSEREKKNTNRFLSLNSLSYFLGIYDRISIRMHIANQKSMNEHRHISIFLLQFIQFNFQRIQI